MLLTEPLSVDAEPDERRRNGEVIDDRIQLEPADQLVVGGDQLKSI